MAIPATLIVLLCTTYLQPALTQANGGCTSQPVLLGLDPPSGTSGNVMGLSTYYTISGQQLDQVASVFVLTDRNLSTQNMVGNNTAIRLYIDDALISPSTGAVSATLFLVPMNSDCLVANITLTLFPNLMVTLQDRPDGQPGTVVFVLSGSCVPPQCGDNSTSYDLMIGNTMLERLNTQDTTLKYAGRIPNYDRGLMIRGADMMMVTQYQTFTLPSRLSFNLYDPVPISVMPREGQRGTNVTVSVSDTFGVWRNVEIFRVRLGETDADVTDSSNIAMIQVRARRGHPDVGYVEINTTYTFEGVRFDGPYTFLENGWTQLLDGNITDIIPPAAQLGRSVLLCGNSLLGGGTGISMIQHGNNTLLQSQPTPIPSGLLPGSECLETQIPESLQSVNQNTITIISNTGAMVTSVSNFSISLIESISPSRGQVDTIVTIRGQGLLSGYDSVVPNVYLSQVRATVMRSSNSEIVVQTGPVPVIQPQVINETMGATEPPPQIIGVMGSILIDVTNPFNSSLSFNVTQSTGWQYEETGAIDTVLPSFGQFGTLLSINGSNLLAYGNMLTQATIDRVNATIVNATNNLVQLTVPDIPNITGPVGITLFSDSGANVRRSNIFEIRERGVVLSAEPNQGQNGTIVRITGTNLFGHGKNITSVLFGEVPGVINTANNTMVEVRVQANNNTVDAAVTISMIADTSAIVTSVTRIWTFLVQGQISSNMPQEGQAGTIIEITGTNLLGGGVQIDEIFLDGVSGSITNSTNSRIVVVMNDLTTQQEAFFPGQIYIMSNTGAIVFGGSYTHRTSGNISNFSPIRGRRGTVVTITGTNVLGFGTNLSSIEIAGISSTIVSFNNTTIIATAGMGTTNLTGPVVIRVDTGAVITSSTNFTFDAPGVINSVDPIRGAEGTGILVRGSGLIPSNVQLINITVGGIPVSRVVTASDQEVSIIVGPAPPTNPDNAMILITASDGSFIGDRFFSFINLSLSLPGLTSGQEGTVIEVNLPSQFDPSFTLQASIDDLSATILSVNETLRRISVRIPRARRHGNFTADVAVEGANGLIARLRNSFTYLAEGVIYVVQPVTGQLGTIITVQGENLLGGGLMAASVTVVGQPTTLLQSNNTVIMVNLTDNGQPEIYPQLGDIVVTADTGAVVRRLSIFSLYAPGVVSQVSPSVGQNGTRVNITGTDLIQGGLTIASVTLAGIPATVVQTPTDMLITVEAAASSITQPLPIVITLSTGATITSPNNLTFRYLPAGDIVSVTPNSGTVGTRVVITGTNLLQGGTTARTVTLGGVPAIIDASLNSTIEVIAQTGSILNTRDVVIISDTGSTLTGTGLWTYEALGSISNVFPSVGQAGLIVTISGQSLLGSASRFSACTLAGIVGQIEGRFNDTALQCRAGINSLNRINETGPVEVLTNTGVMLVSDQNITFTYYAAYIDSISPTQGNNGTVVTIRGVNLFTAPDSSSQLSQVLLGSMTANITSSSANEIIVQAVFATNSTMNDSVRIESTSGSFLELEGAWNYTRPSQIQSVMPSYGFPGDTICLLGEDLFPAGVTTVKVITGQTEALDAQMLNNSVIQFQAGVYQNRDNPAENLTVQIIFPTGQTHVFSDVIFRYNATHERVNSINPEAGSEDSMAVISGINFPNSTDNLDVTLASVTATVLSSTSTEIIVEAGPQPTLGAIGPVVIMDTSTGSTYGLGGNAWEYYPVITNSQVNPPTGQNGTIVTIDLSSIVNLPPIMRVNLTSVPASVIGLNNGTLTVRAGPSNNTPLGDVTIELARSIVIIISQAWSYQSPITISRVSPNSGYFNTLVTIMGNGFQANSVSITAVTLAGVETIIESQTGTQLTVRIARDNSSSTDTTGPITILADSGAFYSSEQQANFTYVGVQVTNISPQSGTRGTLVTLTGVGLLAGGSNITSVTIAGTSASVQNMTSLAVSFVAGPSPSRSNLIDIMYTMDTEAIIRIQNSWSYIDPGVITSVFPSAGGMGTIVSISGENLFGGGNQVIAVMLHSQRTTEILQNFNNFVQVIAAGTTGALQAGSIQIISNTQAITESTSTVQFTYLEPGTVTSIIPITGQDGTTVTIIGMRFHNGEGVDRVLIAGVEARILSVDTSGAMSTVVVEAGRAATPQSFAGPVVIHSSSNTTTVSTQTFTYLTEGVILSVNPSRGRNGTVVSLLGDNILGGGTAVQSVILAGEEATVVNQTTSEVTVTAPLVSSNNSSFSGDIVLVSNTNVHVRRVDGWTYTQRGEVNSVNPPEGQYGTHVMINGQNLLSGGTDIVTLQFGDTLLDVMSANVTTVIARVGQPTSQVAFISSSISITSDTGGVLYTDNDWRFLNQSTITNLDPPIGTSGQLITITGTNLLGGGQGIDSVSIAGILGVVIASNDSEVLIMAGANMDGRTRTGNLILESDTGAQTMAMWTYDNECPSNSFGTADNCQPCNNQCNGCIGPTDLDCISCVNFGIYNSSNVQCVESCPGLSTLDNVCVDACELHQFEQVNTLRNQTFCHNCSSLCDPNLGCTGPEPSQCSGCLFFRDVVNQICIDSCPSDTFPVNTTKECIPCDTQCSGGCSGPSASDCNSCANFRVLSSDMCRATCPSLFFPDSDNTLCVPCDPNCAGSCNGSTPFNCEVCRNVSFTYENGTRICLSSCNSNYYQEGNACKPCSSLCLPGEGCTGPGRNECDVCSLSLNLSSSISCVSECPDSTYFIRNMTRSSTCVKCDDACGDRGCTEIGPQNCLSQASLSAGPGTIAIVIVVILILAMVIVILVILFAWRLKGSSFKFKYQLSSGRNGNEGQDSSTARYATRNAAVNEIPLTSIEKDKTSSNPLYTGGADAFYSEMGPEGVDDEEKVSDVLYNDVEAQPLPEKNAGISASQDVLYTDMDNLPASPMIEEITASQDVYTDMEPILPERDSKLPPPVLPPKPVDLEKENTRVDEPPADLPPVPAKPEKPPPPGPPAAKTDTGAEEYIDMQGGITEVFINAGADDVYDNMDETTSPTSISPPPINDSLYEDTTSPIDDVTYEDTESALVSVEQYRKSFGAGVKSTSTLPREQPRMSFSKRQSAPALPSQPIPKKRSSNTPLPATPLQKSLSSSSTISNPTSPTSSTFSRPESVCSGSGIPEEECLYDDIGAVQPLVNPTPAKASKSQPQKKQPKQKAKKK